MALYDIARLRDRIQIILSEIVLKLCIDIHYSVKNTKFITILPETIKFCILRYFVCSVLKNESLILLDFAVILS